MNEVRSANCLFWEGNQKIYIDRGIKKNKKTKRIREVGGEIHLKISLESTKKIVIEILFQIIRPEF